MADEGAAALKRMASLPFLQDPLWRTVLKFAVIVGWALATTVVSVPFFLALTPFRVQRIRLGNAIAYSWAWVVLFVIGVELEIAGLQHLRNPAIYIMNHTSSLDTMIAALISPWPAAGLAKKEVYFTPMGPLLWMGGGFAIDRSNRARAISTMDAVATFARSNRVGVWIWPEGHRAEDGRLQEFKKGFAHLAAQTGLPVVPVIVTGAHKALPAGGSLKTGRRGVLVRVVVKPAIDTSGWSAADVGKHVAATRAIFNEEIRELAPSQRAHSARRD